mgnify:CR=1 FL=1
MDALEALTTRRSSPRLTTPAPSSEQLDAIIQSALRAADHALLRPSRFLLLQEQSLTKLGELFVAAELADGVDLSPEQREKILNSRGVSHAYRRCESLCPLPPPAPRPCVVHGWPDDKVK